jgi:phage tail-like protein
MQEISGSFRITGPNIEQDHVLVPRSGWTIGRTANNDLMLAHSQISRQHMRLFWQDGGFWVEDLGSTNGVWLNDVRLEPLVPVRLQEGFVIGAGPYTLTFEGLYRPQPSPQAISTVRELPVAPPGVIEMPPVTVRPRVASPQAPAIAAEAVIPRVKVRDNRYPQGIPRDRSNWLQYLPAIYSDPALDPTHFMGRFLLVFESILSPIIWMVDNFDLYLSPETAPPEWMQWMASWFDITIFPELPVERQRAIMRQVAWLFLRRGTRAGLERILELCFGVRPEIFEDLDGSCHFTVRLPLSQSDGKLDRSIAERIIESQKPAFTTYTLDIT